jgi:succinate dehydrogenase / fumarate reductase iron-sulfur subunit
MLDTLNEQLASEGRAPAAFESDDRERICGSCGILIDGVAHGRVERTAVCALPARYFVDAAEHVIEPWRAQSSSGSARVAASARRPVPSASASTSSLA